MTPQEIALLRYSIAPLKADPLRAGQHFYQYLFTFDAALRAHFPEDISQKGRVLVQTLIGLIDALEQDDENTLQAFALRHASLFTPPLHHTFREALLWTLARLLGARFNESAAAAWCLAYNSVAARLKSPVSIPSVNHP